MAYLATEAKSETNQVLAGREVMNALLPHRGGVQVQINNAPRLISHLGVPEVSVVNGQVLKEIPIGQVASDGDVPEPPKPRWTPGRYTPSKKSKKLKRKKNPLKDPRPDLSAAGLTANQALVIEMNSAGMSVPQIARELGKGRSTIFYTKKLGEKKLEKIVHAAAQAKTQFGTKPVEPSTVPLPPNRQLPPVPSLEQPAMPPRVSAYPAEGK